jgi:hypothetical protein
MSVFPRRIAEYGRHGGAVPDRNASAGSRGFATSHSANSSWCECSTKTRGSIHRMPITAVSRQVFPAGAGVGKSWHSAMPQWRRSILRRSESQPPSNSPHLSAVSVLHQAEDNRIQNMTRGGASVFRCFACCSRRARKWFDRNLKPRSNPSKFPPYQGWADRPAEQHYLLTVPRMRGGVSPNRAEPNMAPSRSHRPQGAGFFPNCFGPRPLRSPAEREVNRSYAFRYCRRRCVPRCREG